MSSDSRGWSRRDAITTAVATAFACGLGDAPAARGQDTSTQLARITKAIPSTGEKLPVIGLGTNAYGVEEAAEITARREVLQHMPALGGKIIDTARGYGESETVIGKLLEALGNRKSFFLASKTPMSEGPDQPAARVEESFKRLRTDRIDLMQVHNLSGLEQFLPVLRELKQAGRIRYIGITTSRDNQYEQMLATMRKEALDFIQVDYSLANRDAEERILPLAQERGIAVLANMPLGGRSGNTLLSELGSRKLPDWSKEIDVESWPQLLLKYVVSHPAITAAIPGTTKLRHAQDNQRAGRGRLPDAALRKRMESLLDSA